MEHLLQLWPLESPYRLTDCLLEVFVELAAAFEASLGKTVVEGGRVFRLHKLKLSLELRLKGLNHTIIKHAFFGIRSKYLAKLHRLEAMQL